MEERYFFEGSSIIHKLDPRVKILVIALVSFLTALLSNLYISILTLLFGLVLVLISGISPIIFFKRLLPPLLFIAILWFFLPFSTEGESIFKLLNLNVTKEGILFATKITAKAVSILVVLVILTGTTEMVSLFHALWHLRFPKKLIFLIFFTYRYIHVIFNEYKRIKKALTIRCFTPGTNILTYKTMAYVVGMLLVRSYDRSERVYQAMLCRGFSGEFYVLDHFHIEKKDIIFLTLTLVVYVGVLCLIHIY